MGWFGKLSKETINPFSVYKVLRELVGLMASARAEMRQLRKDFDQHRKEVNMAIDALQANVLSLISIAEAAKVAADAQAAVAVSAATTNADQPAIDALNAQVVTAINVLHPAVVAAAAAAGTPAPVVTPAPAPVAPVAVDPNAPVHTA